MAYQYELGEDIIDTRGLADRWREEAGEPEFDEGEGEEIQAFAVALGMPDDEPDVDVWLDGFEPPGLIHERYWQQYAEQFAEDVGMIERDSSMSTYVDWEKYADDLRMDATSFDTAHGTYYAF